MPTAEQILFHHGEVTVTSLRLVVGKKTYSVATITSASVMRDNETGITQAIYWLILSAAGAMIALVFLPSRMGVVATLTAGFVVASWCYSSRPWGVVVSRDKVNTKALTKADKKTAQDVSDALNVALAARDAVSSESLQTTPPMPGPDLLPLPPLDVPNLVLPPKSAFSSLAKWVIAGLLAALVALFLWYRSGTRDDGRPPAKAELSVAAMEDELKAGRDRSGELVEVTGIVASLGLEPTGWHLRLARSPEAQAIVWCSFKERPDVKVGDRVTIKGLLQTNAPETFRLLGVAIVDDAAVIRRW